jgi:pantoate--beta-alanine ligase
MGAQVSTLLHGPPPGDNIGSAMDRLPVLTGRRVWGYHCSMMTISAIDEMRSVVHHAHGKGRTVAFVPTMGFLHEGHLSLVRRARRLGAFTVVSIYVNPAQFGPGEDLDSYPSDIARDTRLLEDLDVDVLFLPGGRDVYPDGFGTWVSVTGVTEGLCGAARPTHFRGVATVVVKLLNIVGPDVAYFGRKDYQQLRVIEKAVRDLDMPVEIKGCPTVRDVDGVALSSRNAHLSGDERRRARTIPAVLACVASRYMGGERRASSLLEGQRQRLDEVADGVDYLGLYHPGSLAPVGPGEHVPEGPLLARALRIGRTRLIDNLELGVDEPPGPE